MYTFPKVVVAGRNSVKLDRKQERAEKMYLHYVQRWAKDYLRRRLDWIVEDFYGRTEYASNTNPRHLRSALCPCQVSLSFELQIHMHCVAHMILAEHISFYKVALVQGAAIDARRGNRATLVLAQKFDY